MCAWVSIIFRQQPENQQPLIGLGWPKTFAWRKQSVGTFVLANEFAQAGGPGDTAHFIFILLFLQRSFNHCKWLKSDQKCQSRLAIDGADAALAFKCNFFRSCNSIYNSTALLFNREIEFGKSFLFKNKNVMGMQFGINVP